MSASDSLFPIDRHKTLSSALWSLSRINNLPQPPLTDRPTVLKSFRLFDDLPETVLADIEKQCHFASYGPGDMVAATTDIGRGAFFLYGGEATMTRCSESGGMLSLGTLKIGEWCGAESTLCNKPLGFDITAKKVSLFMRMSAQTFLGLASIPVISMRIAERMAEKLTTINERMFSLAFESSRARCRREITAFVTANPEAGNIPATELAFLAGVARETVSRELTTMVREGILKRVGPRNSKHRYYVVEGDINADPEVPFGSAAYRGRRTWSKVAT